MKRKIRILIAKLGLDTHDRGAKIIAQRCKEAGMEVIYLGLYMATLDDIVNTAIQEDVDVIGLSSMTGLHLSYCPQMMERLKGRNLNDVLVILGGIVPRQDIPTLKQMGIDEVFPSGSSMEKVVQFITGNVKRA